MKRKRQYSLFALLVVVTVVACVLGWRYSRPPSFGPSSQVNKSGVVRGSGATYRELAAYVRIATELETVRGVREVEFRLVVIVPDLTGTQIVYRGTPGPERWQRRMGVQIGFLDPSSGSHFPKIIPKVEPAIIFDAYQNTVTLGETTLPFSGDSVCVIVVDDNWETHLSVVDRELNIPGISAGLLDEIRAVRVRIEKESK